MTGSVLTGKVLSLAIRGASHAREIGMTLSGFVKGFKVDMAKLQEFMERRAPGRDETSTARREPDVPEFLRGLDAEGRTTGETIDARILNTNVRSQDYASVKTVPRPGHSDYPVWVKTGVIPPGGGCHSGRLTAAMCIAGGICKQYLAERGIEVTATTARTAEEILAVKREGDSIGGRIVCTVTGMPKGLGWAMFEGLESMIAQAMFGIPGVKAISFGDGEKAADMKGSEFNDAFQGGEEVTLKTNHSGGLTGGMTNGAPVVFTVTMRPTPSIYKAQESVDLKTGQDAELVIKGRHDPCIALRAVPVVEALAAVTMCDAILSAERATPRICLTLTGRTVEEDLAILRRHRDHTDMCELRVDYLESAAELEKAKAFPAHAKMPVLLTARRECDGGKWKDEAGRAAALKELIGCGFKYVDLECDFHDEALKAAAKAAGVRVVRSMHEFGGTVKNLPEALRALKGETDEIPKIAFMPQTPDEVTEAFREMKDFREFDHIVCAMGHLGKVTRILAGRLGSMLTFASDGEAETKKLGHLTPEELVRTYRFRMLTKETNLYAVTGWPLEVTGSPELNNAAFGLEQEDKVLVPFPAEKLEEFFRFAEVMDIKGTAVTVPHKEAAAKSASELSAEAKEIGAVNTLVKTAEGWKGFNTDAPGFAAALTEFLGTETLQGLKVAIVGAGGAAKAVAYAVHQLGGDAVIYNRTREKAEAIACKYWFRVGTEMTPADVIVQTTSVGLNSDADALQGYEFTGKESLFDLIYHPAQTTAMRRCEAAGGRSANGWSMLVNQAKEQRRIYRDYE